MMSILRSIPAIAALFTLSGLAACGGGGGDNPGPPVGPTPGLSVSASPATIQIKAGESSNSTISISRTGGYTGTVSLSVTGQPTSVTATITPAQLEAGANSATVSWSATSGAEAGSHTITVRATGASVAAASATAQLVIAPPNALPPASIEVAAGNGQTVAAGEAVTVKPRVIVKAANGSPLSGVQVTFVRDSGGGAIRDSIVNTAADGSAELGEWRPGPGRNVVRAVVNGLDPITFLAIGTGGMKVIEQTVSPSGGTVGINRPGDPLDGFQLTVPDGSYNGALDVAIAYEVGGTVPGRAETRPASPLITMGSNRSGIANNGPLTVRVPVELGANEWPVAVIRNPSTGAFRTVPAVALDNKTAVLALEYFDATLIGPNPSTAGSNMLAARALPQQAPEDTLIDSQYLIQFIIGAVPYSALTGELDTGYRPNVDNWEFDQIQSKIRPWLRYSSGLAIAAAWYYDHFKAGRGALHGRFQKADGVEASNAQGMRLANEIDVWQNTDAMAKYNASLVLMGNTAGISADSVKLLLIKSALYQTGRPQLLTASTSGGVVSTALLVYRARGNNLDITLGTSIAGAPHTQSILFSSSGISPLSFGVKDIDSDSYQTVTTSQYFIEGQYGFGASQLNSWWQQVFAESVGGSNYPDWYLATKEDPRVSGDTIWVVDDSTRLWVECNCENGHEPGPEVTPTDKIAGAHVYLRSGNSWQPLERSIMGRGLLLKAEDDGKEIGLVITERLFSGGGSFVDWTSAVIKKREVEITPDSASIPPDSLVTFTADIDMPLPPSPVWEWDLGDGRVITTDTKTLEAEYPPAEDGGEAKYQIKVRIKSNDKVWATGKTAITVKKESIFAWRILTLSDADELFDDETSASGEIANLLRRLIAVPRSGLISIEESNNGGRELRLRVRPSSVWADGPVPPYSSGAERMTLLGVDPRVNYSFGPYFSAWSFSSWSQTSEDLETGSMMGQYVLGETVYSIKDAGSQRGPAGVLTLDANRVGDSMTGTIRVYIWFEDPDDGLLDGPADVYSLPFTATRAR